MPESDATPTTAAFSEIGLTGLQHSNGRVLEEWMPQLQGVRGARIYREMYDNDPIIGGIVYSIEEVLRSVAWLTEPAGPSPDEQAAAEFVDECMDDMSNTWPDFISEALSKIVFGWSFFESCYKRREGRDGEHRSKYDDGLIGWRKFAYRSQDTLERWEFDDDGGVAGLWQSTATSGSGTLGGGVVFIPIEKALLFRTTTRKGNPEGRSVLRNAYTGWWAKKRVEQFELIGIERDLAGIPSFGLPPEMFDSNADAETKAALEDYRRAATQLRVDEQSSLVWPMYRDENGNLQIEIGLLKSPGSRQHNTDGIIERYARWMAISTLQDVIMLGHEHVGSLALADVKKSMGMAAMRAQLEEIAAVFNRIEIPRLFRLNGLDPALAPTLRPGEIEQRDLEQLAAIIKATAEAGLPWFPNESIQNEIFTALGFDPVDVAADDGTAFEPTTAPTGDEDEGEDEADDVDDAAVEPTG
jgi:hypothetical protein